jgi:hypothetical protein
MIRVIVQWQDQFGKWHRFQEKHNATDSEALGSVVTA